MSCCVFGCTNSYKNTLTSNPKIHFYKFPFQPWEKDRRQNWINFANRKCKDGKIWQPYNGAAICSAHFIGNKKSEHPHNSSFNPTLHQICEVANKKKVKIQRFERQNVDKETVLNNVQCIICGTTSIVNTSYLKSLTKSSVVQENNFNSWKNDCAKATCEVLFDDKSGHFIKYFKEADYCSGCQQLVRDICFTWKHLKVFQNTIDNLSNKISELIDLNYQKIPENLKSVEERLSSYLSKHFTQIMPTFSREEFLQIMHTVANKRGQNQYNNMHVLDDCEIKTEAASDVEIYSELEENSDLESNSHNPENTLLEINSGIEKTSQDGIEQRKETVSESEEEEYTLIEITPENSTGVAEDTVSVIDQSNPFTLKDSKNTVDLKRNRMQLVNKAHPYQCDICDKIFSCTKFLKFHHLKMHEDEKNLLFKCTVCDKRFALESWLILHIRESHKKPEQPQPCEICNKTFKTSAGLKSHITSVHKKCELKCSVCDRSFKSSLRRNAHEQLHSQYQILNSKDQQRVLLQSNTARFTLTQELNSHYTEAHLGPNPFCCAFCPKIFNNSVDLQRHVKFNHPEPGSSAVELKCDVCERYFLSRYNFKMHKLKHGDPSLMLKCQLCPAMFPMRSGLNAHLKCHTIERKFICEVCGKAFKTVNSLKTHIHYHGEKNVQCKLCDKKFFKNSHRKNHESIVHTNVKDYICQVCGKAFNHKGNLRGHLKLHESKGEM